MFVFLSKLLPILVYPVGISCLILILALLLRNRERLRTALIVAVVLILWLAGNRWVALTLARS
ncbi:MAG: YdcF family protein, partial [Anaerolineaceae bacterium]